LKYLVARFTICVQVVAVLDEFFRVVEMPVTLLAVITSRALNPVFLKAYKGVEVDTACKADTVLLGVLFVLSYGLEVRKSAVAIGHFIREGSS
jgi:hypothetical protein